MFNKQGIDCKLTTLMHPTSICVLAITRGKPANAPAPRKWPHRVRYKSASFNPGTNAIQVMTMQVSKGLKGLAFPVVALPGVGHVPAAGEEEAEAARVFDVAAARATQRLVMGVGRGAFGRALSIGRASAQTSRKSDLNKSE